MALESVNPPVIITARDFFFKIKESTTFRTTFRTTGLLYPYLFDLKKKNISQARTWGKPIIKLG